MPRARLTPSWSSTARRSARSRSSWPRRKGLESWISAGSAISANTKTPAEWYAGAYKLKVANDIATGATAIGFDASDLMPPAVGQGSFWTGISDWANSNGSNTDAVLKAIDDSWPEVGGQ